jgi:hypothetical protein
VAREPRSGEALWNSDIEIDGTRDGRPRRIQIRARDVIFAGERWNVRGFRRGGSLVVEEQADGQTRRVQASCDGAGNPVWSYAVNGRSRPFDAAARRWMESIIREFTG